MKTEVKEFGNNRIFTIVELPCGLKELEVQVSYTGHGNVAKGIALDTYIVPLMKAAPDMLEALDLLFEDWKTLVGEDLKENNEDVHKIWAASELAINKAKGKA